MTKIIAVSGYKDSGKTTLCAILLEELAKLGVRAGYIKRTDDSAVYGEGATDTGAARARGVDSVLWAKDGIVLESSLPADTTAAAIAARYFPDAEIVILEGGKELNLPKIWVCSDKDGKTVDYPGIFIRYDRRAPDTDEGRGLFGAGGEARIAAVLAALVQGGAYRSASVYIGDRPLPLKDFVADFIRGGVLGMIGSLKGADIDSDVRIYIKRDPLNIDS